MSLFGEFDGGIPVRPIKKNLNQMRKQFTALKDTPQPVLTMPMMTLRLVMIPMRILTGVVIYFLISLDNPRAILGQSMGNPWQYFGNP